MLQVPRRILTYEDKIAAEVHASLHHCSAQQRRQTWRLQVTQRRVPPFIEVMPQTT